MDSSRRITASGSYIYAARGADRGDYTMLQGEAVSRPALRRQQPGEERLLVQSQGYGPTGRANEAYEDVYRTHISRRGHPGGPGNTAPPPGGFRFANRGMPPYDMSATLPNAGGKNFDATGTWRDITNSALGDASGMLDALITQTLPEPALMPATAVPVRRSHLSLADGNPHLHTETIMAPHVHRAPNISPGYYRQPFSRTERSSTRSDGSKVTPFLVDVPLPNAPWVPYNRQTAAWLPPYRGIQPDTFVGGALVHGAHKFGYSTVGGLAPKSWQRAGLHIVGGADHGMRRAGPTV